MNFSDGENPIPVHTLARGPDVLRPSSANARWGQGRAAFFYTRYPDDTGKRLHVFGAGVGHERHITDRNIIKGFFGPDLEKIEPEITYEKTIYGPYDPKKGGYPELGVQKAIDHWKVRDLAMKDNILGRHGYIGDVEVLMFWGIPKDGGWGMVNDVIDQLHVGPEARIVNGTQELGPVWKFKEEHAKGSKKKTVDQDTERIKALARYHVATGGEKEALKTQYGFGGGTLKYPDASKMSPEEIEKYPWKRGHWRSKARELGLSDPFDYGEAFVGFASWLKRLEAV